MADGTLICYAFNQINAEPNKPASVEIKFPQTFIYPPVVVTNAETSLPGEALLGYSATYIYKDRFSFFIKRADNKTTNFHYIAIGRWK